MKIQYTPEATNDLREIKYYIGTVLRNTVAATRITKMILSGCGSLKQFPEAGVSLQAMTGYETALRMLVCESYIALYRIDSDAISIVRIINAKQDYMQILLREPNP